MDRYPFLIRAPGTTRKRLVHIVAASYKQALNVILSTIPSKFISTKFARNMDLISAKVEAAKASRTKNKQVWIVTNDRDGECAISLTEEANKGWTVYTSYKNGSEIALTPAAEQTRKDKPVTTIKIKSVKKQIDPRVTIMEKVAKKAAPAKASKAEKSVKVKTIARGNNMFLTAEEWKKVDAKIAKLNISFSAWSRGLVQSSIK